MSKPYVVSHTGQRTDPEREIRDIVTGSLSSMIGITGTVHLSANQLLINSKVSDILALGMGLSVEDKFRCQKSGYSMDMRVYDMRVNAKSSTAAATDRVGWTVTVESRVDGPSHFLTCRLKVGGTLMKSQTSIFHLVTLYPGFHCDRFLGFDLVMTPPTPKPVTTS
jgi:hypothetical protein